MVRFRGRLHKGSMDSSKKPTVDNLTPIYTDVAKALRRGRMILPKYAEPGDIVAALVVRKSVWIDFEDAGKPVNKFIDAVASGLRAFGFQMNGFRCPFTESYVGICQYALNALDDNPFNTEWIVIPKRIEDPVVKGCLTYNRVKCLMIEAAFKPCVISHTEGENLKYYPDLEKEVIPLFGERFLCRPF